MPVRLVSLLACKNIQRDDAGTWNLNGVHNRLTVSEFPVEVTVQVFARYSGVYESHQVTLEVRDRATSELVTCVAGEMFPKIRDEYLDAILAASMVVHAPGWLMFRLLINGGEIGRFPYLIDQMPLG